MLLLLVIDLEILAPIAIIIGWRVRVISLLLAGFTLVSGVVFRSDFADQTQMVMFLKNLSITSVFLARFVSDTGKFSIDRKIHQFFSRKLPWCFSTIIFLLGIIGNSSCMNVANVVSCPCPKSYNWLGE